MIPGFRNLTERVVKIEKNYPDDLIQNLSFNNNLNGTAYGIRDPLADDSRNETNTEANLMEYQEPCNNTPRFKATMNDCIDYIKALKEEYEFQTEQNRQHCEQIETLKNKLNNEILAHNELKSAHERQEMEINQLRAENEALKAKVES